MNTCSDISENERQAQDELVALSEGMLGGTLSFFEGAARVVALRASLGKIEERDKDFDVFAVIASETDHLPLAAARQHWAAESLERLAPEYDRTEQWAVGFAPQACKNLVARFQRGSSYPEAQHA